MVDFAALAVKRREQRASLADARASLLNVLRSACAAGAVPVRGRPVLEVVPEFEPPPTISMSADQAAAVDRVIELLADPSRRVVSLAGAAGTGKTTCVSEIRRRLGVPYVQAAPTGKAALRLKQVSGAPAVTLHRIAYQGADEQDDGALVFNRREKASLRGSDLFDLGGQASSRDVAAALRGGGRAVVIVDEASMVGASVLNDLIGERGALGPKVQILAVGDHCQLPPVNAEPAFDLEHADAKLDKVHRQADGGRMLALVTHLRTERVPLTSRICQQFGFRPEFLSGQDLAQRIAVQVGFCGRESVVLTNTNRQRMAINRLTREAMGFPPMSEGPQVGESVIALANNYRVDCANGEIGTVVGVDRWDVEGLLGYRVSIDFGDRVAAVTTPHESWADDDERSAGKVSRAHRDAIKAVEWMGGRAGLEAGRVAKLLTGIAPAYALTVHKSQGSEWPSGYVVLGRASWLGEDEWRLSYTAATRFRDDAVFVVGGGA